MRILSTVLITAALTACGVAPKKDVEIPYRPASETEAAIRAMKAEWFVKCGQGTEAIPTTPPKNEVGSLLQDNSVISASAAACFQRHNALVDYLYPVFLKERSK